MTGPIILPDNRDVALAGLRRLTSASLLFAIASQAGAVKTLETVLERGPSDANIRELLADLKWGLAAAKDEASSRGIHLPE
jgi:hypothetical protein